MANRPQAHISTTACITPVSPCWGSGGRQNIILGSPTRLTTLLKTVFFQKIGPWFWKPHLSDYVAQGCFLCLQKMGSGKK